MKTKAKSFEFPNQVDELGSVVVVAAELKDPAVEGKQMKEPVVQRPAPPNARFVFLASALWIPIVLVIVLRPASGHARLIGFCCKYSLRFPFGTVIFVVVSFVVVIVKTQNNQEFRLDGAR